MSTRSTHVHWAAAEMQQAPCACRAIQHAPGVAALQRGERAPGGAAEGVGGVPANEPGRQRHQRRVARLAAGALPPQVQPARLLARASGSTTWARTVPA